MKSDGFERRLRGAVTRPRRRLGRARNDEVTQPYFTYTAALKITLNVPNG